jgi:hypothetical protein
VFKVTNSVRFDVNPNNNFNNVSTGGSLEVYGATLTAPRVQQFSLRYPFKGLGADWTNQFGLPCTSMQRN